MSGGRILVSLRDVIISFKSLLKENIDIFGEDIRVETNFTDQLFTLDYNVSLMENEIQICSLSKESEEVAVVIARLHSQKSYQKKELQFVQRNATCK